MLTPKIGDVVQIEGTVVRLDATYFTLEQEGILGITAAMKIARITKIVDVPPKPGDTVWWDEIKNSQGGAQYAASHWHGSTLRYVHQNPGDDRKWAVVAFEGDIPYSIPYNCIRKTRECAA